MSEWENAFSLLLVHQCSSLLLTGSNLHSSPQLESVLHMMVVSERSPVLISTETLFHCNFTPVPLTRESERAAWWSAGRQPRDTHTSPEQPWH